MSFAKDKKGMTLTFVLVTGTIAAMFLIGVASWGILNLKAAKQAVKKEMAAQIAESGIEYYRWHLAHDADDYQDGTGVSGPYVHQFYDRSGNLLGQFSLDITPPPVGSSLVTIASTGKVNSEFFGSRKITSILAKPSLARFAVAANNNMRFGAGTDVYGPIHSNAGIRFDGQANNIVTSALSDYNDPDHDGNNEFGVHTHVNPPPGSGVEESFRSLEAPPNTVPSRTEIFRAGREFPTPAIDFSGFTADISEMKSAAQASGFYRAGSGALGYYLLLKTNDTFDFYTVNTLKSPPSNCSYSSDPTWGTWSINTKTLLGNYPFPANGLIFLEDNVFVDGQINTARLTIVAAIFPDNVSLRKNITVNNDLLYTNYDGQDVISLIAQNNFNVGLYSADVLRIDAALIAQNGRVGRYYYTPSDTDHTHCGANAYRQTLTLYGMLASNLRYGFAYTNGTGYQTRNLIYDARLLYSPPPSFPQTSEQYTIISWGETR